MSAFCARCLSPHRKITFFTVCGCESRQYGTLQLNASNVYKGQYSKRLLTFSMSDPCVESHCCFVQSVNNYSVLAVGQRSRQKERIPRPHQSLNLVVSRVHFSTWVKTQLDNILYRLRKITSITPNRFSLKHPGSVGSSKSDQAKQSKSGQTSHLLLPLENPASEKQSTLPIANPALKKLSTKKQDTKPTSQSEDLPTREQQEISTREQPTFEPCMNDMDQAKTNSILKKLSTKKQDNQPASQSEDFHTREQHTFEQCVVEMNQCLCSDHRGSKSIQQAAFDNQINQLTTSMKEENSWRKLKMLQLPFIPNTFRPAKEENVTKLLSVETTTSKRQLSDNSEHNIKESSTGDDEHKFKELLGGGAIDTKKRNILPYVYVSKQPEHLIRDNEYELTKTQNGKIGWNMFRNFFALLTHFRFPWKSSSVQMLPAIKSSADKQSLHVTDLKQTPQEKVKQIFPKKDSDQSLSVYHPLIARRPPTSKDQTESTRSAEEEEVGWSVFKKIANPFRSNSIPEQKSILREKGFVSQTHIDAKTQMLVSSLRTASTYALKMDLLKKLCLHIKEFPSSRYDLIEFKAVPLLLRLMQSGNQEMGEEILEALALLGYNAPVRGRGIRILCLDGGGTRALVSIKCMKELEKLSNRKIYELFDYVCGVSTGALLSTIVFLFRIPLDECESLYHNFSQKMFSRSRVFGTGGLVWNYAFYDSDQWEQILREEVGYKPMIDFARDPMVPKVAAVSTIINTPRMENFVFRNYTFPPSMYSKYPGSCTNEMWEVIRASSAAPGYYEDFSLGNYVHSDGGLLANNPTALAIHESHLLWPGESIQCLVSLGTGRYEHILDLNVSTKVSLKEKVTKMMENATDTEAVHVMMADVMPPNTYFRFNPYLSEDLPLDEIRPDRLDAMKRDTTMYLRKNDLKIRKAADTLRKARLPHQRMKDWLQLKSDTHF